VPGSVVRGAGSAPDTDSKRLRPERGRVGVGPHAQLEMQTETRNDSITDS